MSLCPFSKYSNILGHIGHGVHQFKVLNVSIIDYIMTLIGAMVIAYFTKIPLVLTTIALFILGIILHTLFGVPTEAVKYLGLAC